MSDNENNSINSSSLLSERIDAQLEAYRKISADYAEIITSLEQFKTEIDDLKREYRKEYKDLLSDITKMSNGLDVRETNTQHVLCNLRDIVDKQYNEVTRLVSAFEIYKTTLEGHIKLIIEQMSHNETVHKEYEEGVSVSLSDTQEVLSQGFSLLQSLIETKFADVKTDMSQNETNIKEKLEDRFKPFVNTPGQISMLHKELVDNRKRLNIRLYWVAGTLLAVMGIIETLVQLGVISVQWFK